MNDLLVQVRAIIDARRDALAERIAGLDDPEAIEAVLAQDEATIAAEVEKLFRKERT